MSRSYSAFRKGFLLSFFLGILVLSALGIIVLYSTKASSKTPPQNPAKTSCKTSGKAPVQTPAKSRTQPERLNQPWHPAGFVNPGNFCYRNAALQVLFHLKSVDFCTGLPAENPPPLMSALCASQGQVNTERVVDNDAISALLPDPYNNPSLQQDAYEFLINGLMVALGKDLASFPELADRVLGMLDFNVDIRQHSECFSEKTFDSIQHGTPLQLNFAAMPQTDIVLDVVELLKTFSYRREKLDCDCPRCKLDIFLKKKMQVDKEKAETVVNTHKTLEKEMTGFPRVAMIQLPRFFRYPDNTMVRVKNVISAPLTGLKLHPDGTMEQPTYRLVGVIEIVGSTPNIGHYKANVLINGKWWHFNDRSVSELPEAEIITDLAYILFYESETMQPPDRVEH